MERHATLMAYTLGQAAQATGKSKTTIKRALEKGRISGKKNDSGEWQIEPVELHRIYPAKEQDTVPGNSKEATSDNRELQARLEAAEQRIADKEEVIDDLRCRLDQSEDKRRRKDQQLTALLTDQREKPKRAFWRWLIGQSNDKY